MVRPALRPPRLAPQSQVPLALGTSWHRLPLRPPSVSTPGGNSGRDGRRKTAHWLPGWVREGTQRDLPNSLNMTRLQKPYIFHGGRQLFREGSPAQPSPAQCQQSCRHCRPSPRPRSGDTVLADCPVAAAPGATSARCHQEAMAFMSPHTNPADGLVWNQGLNMSSNRQETESPRRFC